MSIDVTDATFPTEVVERSKQVPVVVDLWAEWCGPCKSLGPILEKVVDDTQGKVVLAKVDVDTNRQVAGAFQVQSIPAVYALKDGKVVDGFVGAQPEAAVRQFVEGLLPSAEESAVADLVAKGDEASLREALVLEPGHEGAVLALAELLVARRDEGDVDEALAVLARIPESAEVRRIAAIARIDPDTRDDVTDELDTLLDSVKDDEAARQRYLDLLEVMGPDDPRTAGYRKQLTARLF
ncbi:MAG: thioredoxin [Acidimicrobiales bacterium]